MPATKKSLTNKKSKGAVKGSTKVTGAAKAHIVMPPARIMKMMRRDRLQQRIGKGAAVYMAGVLDYIASEILECSGDVAESAGKKRINPRHLKLAIANDDELLKLTAGSIIHEGGVNPHIEEFLLPAKKGGKKTKTAPDASQEV